MSFLTAQWGRRLRAGNSLLGRKEAVHLVKLLNCRCAFTAGTLPRPRCLGRWRKMTHKTASTFAKLLCSTGQQMLKCFLSTFLEFTTAFPSTPVNHSDLRVIMSLTLTRKEIKLIKLPLSSYVKIFKIYFAS